MPIKRRPVLRSEAEDAIDTHVGNRIKLRRNVLNLSQEKLALACHISFQQIQKYEMGMNRVSASRLYQIAQALQCEPAYFFEDLPPTTSGTTAAQDPMKASRAVDLVLHFNRIAAVDEHTGHILLTLIRHISGDTRVQSAAAG